MSQNKTVVSGINYENIGNENIDDLYGSLYSRGADEIKRTYVSGAGVVSPVSVLSSPKVVASSDTPLCEQPSRQVSLQNRVVVGVLFSVSRGLLGEIFPIYLGRNVIGQAEYCDICLYEKTVSPEHAILNIRKEDYPSPHFEMSLTDYASTYGVLVNNTDGRYEQLPVSENDVITIGRHYKFIIKTFDTDSKGLTEDEEFEESKISSPVGTNEAQDDVSPVMSSEFYAPSSKKSDSNRTVLY